MVIGELIKKRERGCLFTQIWTKIVKTPQSPQRD